MRLVIAALTLLVGCYAARDNTTYQCGHATVLVSQGDTLWSVVGTYCSGNIEAAVTDAIELNGGTTIHANSWIQLP